MQTITQRLESYVEYLRLYNFSTSTIKSYRLWLKQFLEFRADQKISEHFTQEQARLFILLKMDGGLSWSSINCLYSSLRKYYKEVLDVEFWKDLKQPSPHKN